jgi:hypothetical protein
VGCFFGNSVVKILNTNVLMHQLNSRNHGEPGENAHKVLGELILAFKLIANVGHQQYSRNPSAPFEGCSL